MNPYLFNSIHKLNFSHSSSCNSRPSENDEYTVVYGATSEKDLQFLLDYTKKFQASEFASSMSSSVVAGGSSRRETRSNSEGSVENNSKQEESKSVDSMDTSGDLS